MSLKRSNLRLSLRAFRNKRGERGVALMMILWVLILLDIIVLQFASAMRTEVEITRNFRDRVESYYLARAGMEVAKFELQYVGSVSQSHGRDSENSVDLILEEEWREINPLWERTEPLGRGYYTIEYHVKEERYDLNQLASGNGETELEDILISCGMEAASAELSMIKRSIMDWVDKDSDLSGPDIGAEDDWYEENWQGYPCKDDRFYSVEELALIRGLRPEPGDSEEERDYKKQLLECLYDQVDADPFLPIWNINESFVDCNILIRKYGEESGREKCEDRNQVAKGRKPGIYTVIATGWIKGGLAQRQIKAEFDVRKARELKQVSWTDNYTPLQEADPNHPLAEEPVI